MKKERGGTGVKQLYKGKRGMGGAEEMVNENITPFILMQM
jgi:hypothetical protein